jgi:uncharacterized protein (TIGR02996 family)
MPEIDVIGRRRLPEEPMRTFTFSDAKSHKFWNIELQGNSFTVTYGRQGTAGQTQTKTFRDAAAAQREHDKLIKEKLAKGYKETTPAARPAGGSLREALEAALVENPDDLAAHAAYADHLQEEGDPRGEFIQVQLELEDESKTAAQRKKLAQREAALLEAHAKEWLGDLAPHLLAPEKKEKEWSDPTYRYQFRRGWLDTLEATNYQVDFTRVLAHAPQTRLLRCLYLNEEGYQEPGTYEVGDDSIPEGSYNPALWALTRSPYLGNVRVLRYGETVNDDERYFNCHMSGEPVLALVKLMPRLEVLHLLTHNLDSTQLFGLRTLTHLRELLVYHEHNYPLHLLAKNPGFANLTHLLCHPHAVEYDAEPDIRLPQLRAVCRSKVLTRLTHLRLRMSDFGDKGCEEIVSSGILKRLKVLDLRNNCITDAGAATLAACPDLKNLELLDLDRNCLTDTGIAALKATGVGQVVARDQWRLTGAEDTDREYLYEGDGE